MKLSKKDYAILSDISHKLLKAETFIKDSRTTVIRDFGNFGKSEINKMIGSELVYLYAAREYLNNFITESLKN